MSNLLVPQQLHDYQNRAIHHVVQWARSMLWIGTGLGKTVITLTAIWWLKQQGQLSRGAIVFGPLRVVESVWEREARKWAHLQSLRFSLVTGDAKQRLRALMRPADIYLINYENVAWLALQLTHFFLNRGYSLPFSLAVFDEITKMKNASSVRMREITPILPHFSRRVGLTGSPAGNGLKDLFGQFFVLDDGMRLGTKQGIFESSFFTRAGDNSFKLIPTESGREYIYNRVSDMTLQLRKEDYIKLPDLIENDIWVDLPKRHRAQYNKLEQELFAELDDGTELSVNFEASKINKCLQFSNGQAYIDTETKEWRKVHDLKLDALEDVIEEAGGNQVLVAYLFQIDAIRIKERFPQAVCLTGMSKKEFDKTLDRWQAGEIELLLGHPASMGHGVDGLQKSGHIIFWMGVPWSWESYDQFNARLHRQGQGEPVTVHRCFCRDTADEIPREAIRYKEGEELKLRDAVDAYRNKRK